VSGQSAFSIAELDADPRSAAEARALVALGRELEAVDPGESVGPVLVEAVMAAIVAEATPRPSSAWIVSLRRRRALRTIAALRDSFRVAFGPAARPFGARLAAAPVALATLILLGSVGVAGAGAAGVRFPDSATPPPTAPAVAPTTRPSRSTEPSDAREPSEPVEPSPEQSEPKESPGPRPTDQSSSTPTPRSSSKETSEPTSRESPESSDDGGSSETTGTPEPAGSSEAGDG
jgi:hypothetical protein